MKIAISRTVLILMLAVTVTAVAQVGHPVKGSWLGYYGPNADDQTRLRLLLDWEDRQIVGTINPGRNGIPLERAELDVSTWTLTIAAELPLTDGTTAPFVATGQLENLGSWTNRTFSGSYSLGNERGQFRVVLN